MISALSYRRLRTAGGEQVPVTTSDEVKSTLQGREVHDGWTRDYRTAENEAFYDLAFDYLATVFGKPDDGLTLDAGCGSSTKTIHLAKRGYRVVAADVSQGILDSGRHAVVARELDTLVTYRWADLTGMEFSTGEFVRVLCWGVLMHVPDVERAVAELARVTRAGGTIVVSEGNMRSVQAVGLRWLKRALGRQRAEVRRVPAGVEFWEDTSAGKLVTRQADIGWLIGAFESHGAKLMERRAGEFSEIYTLVKPKTLRRAIHAFNSFWWRLRWPGLAFGNLLIFRKP